MQDEEKLFIEALRGLNHQASILQAEETASSPNIHQSSLSTNNISSAVSDLSSHDNEDMLHQDIQVIDQPVSQPLTAKKEVITKGSALFPSVSNSVATSTTTIPNPSNLSHRISKDSLINKDKIPSNSSVSDSAALKHANFEFGKATSVVTELAVKLNQNNVCSPNIQAALSWMEAIRRKEPERKSDETSRNRSDSVSRSRSDSDGSYEVIKIRRNLSNGDMTIVSKTAVDLTGTDSNEKISGKKRLGHHLTDEEDQVRRINHSFQISTGSGYQ